MINIEELTLSILTNTTVIPEFKSKDGDLTILGVEGYQWLKDWIKRKKLYI